MKSRPRFTVRLRLTLLFAGLMLATGVALVAITYTLTRANLQSGPSGALPALQGRPAPHGLPPAQLPGLVRAARDQLAHQTLGRLLTQDALVLAALTALAAGLGWWLSGRALRPLAAITNTARRITGERLHQRLALQGRRDELTDLADTFDGMLARLDSAFRSQRLFAANAAHELRRPLAVMRTELDLALTDPDPSVEELQRMASKLDRTLKHCQQLTDRLLVLTRGTLGSDERRPIALDELASRAAGELTAAAQSRGVDVRLDLRPATALGDSQLLAQLVDNLIENAIVHNHPDGWVAIATSVEDDRVELKVSNSGMPLAGEPLDELLEPFRRGDTQRLGSRNGLGLSIARTVADAHGGRLELIARPDGGLDVAVTLAAATASSAPSVLHEPPVTAKPLRTAAREQR